MIQDFVNIYSPLNDIYLPLFATDEGRKVYKETLDAVKKQFPQYVREIQGTADGANVPFSKVCVLCKKYTEKEQYGWSTRKSCCVSTRFNIDF